MAIYHPLNPDFWIDFGTLPHKIQVILKLSELFSRYLYQNKTLALPGIGIFSIDPSVHIPEANDRNISEFYSQIRYVQQPVLRPDEEFIEFIRTHTGKIRPLAESDLESYLSDGKILLNIGRPFYFEGIGSIQKTRQGNYEFIPGPPLVDRLEVPHEEISSEDARQRFESAPFRQAQNNTIKQILVILAILVGLSLIIWGGYTLYKSKTTEQPAEPAAIESAEPVSADSITQQGADSSLFSTSAPVPSADPSGSRNYQFIIESTTNKGRASRRYNQILTNGQPIKMDVAPDSSVFHLYFDLPATPMDTTRMKDSLRRYYGVGRVVIR